MTTNVVQNELASLWRNLLADLREPDLVWQILALAACLALAKLVERYVHGRARAEGGLAALSEGGLRRVAFPLVALCLAFAAREGLRPWLHVNLLSLALPLLGSLAAIRLVFYVLRHSFANAHWLGNFERGFSLTVWGLVALHITGLLPEVRDILQAVAIPVGKQKLTLLQLINGIATVLVTVLAALWVSGVIESRLNAAQGLDSNLRAVFSRLARALLLLVAVLVALPMVGIDLTMLSVFGGALGVGLGFGLQKIASNYVSGFIILLDRSIRIGNTISVGNDRGVVTRITTRYTVLRNGSGVEALVPNESLVGSVVQNETYSDKQVRLALSVQVAYDSDLEQAMAVLVEAAKEQPRVLAEPAPAALLTAFADSGINLELGFWIMDPELGAKSLCSDIYLAIWRRFQAAGIAIPFPQRDLRIVHETAHG